MINKILVLLTVMKRLSCSVARNRKERVLIFKSLYMWDSTLKTVVVIALKAVKVFLGYLTGQAGLNSISRCCWMHDIVTIGHSKWIFELITYALKMKYFE